MGKKKNKPLIRPWCWYCEREFEDEKVLMQHQKAKHFKCGMCPRRLNTAGGLAVHIQQVHKLEADNLPRIENALPGRDGYEVEIFGMEGIPAPDIADYKRRKEIELGLNPGSISQPQAKRVKTENRALTEDELRAQLEAHKALMGGGGDASKLPAAAADTSSTPVYGAPAQAYSVPPTPAGPTPPVPFAAPPAPYPGAPPMMPPGASPGLVPPGFPPFAPPLPPGATPPVGFPVPPFPPGAMPPFPPGPPGAMRPPFPPPGFVPPPGMPLGMGLPPPGAALPGPPGAVSPPPPPQFVPAQNPVGLSAPGVPPQLPPSVSGFGGPGVGVGGGQAGHQGQVPAPPPLTLPNPSLAQTNPEFKKPTSLKYADANFSPEEHRARHAKYYFAKGQEQGQGTESAAYAEEPRGKKRARAEDFL
ncbi:hypothetical protein EST38_g3202 [Candolleomyces aberdarensis]|uniref:C2H2-type domain-containing protein n=1 Tax=Candolleomyces aberdarensis TaxID=2316362 RepID=A0A4Q2DST4_9AGAR|nr:hypothetical protein EST38_g3202 [Candolleomyces aberdarensis]